MVLVLGENDFGGEAKLGEMTNVPLMKSLVVSGGMFDEGVMKASVQEGSGTCGRTLCSRNHRKK